MTDNTFNLDELNELKQAYQLIDEKLDGKEIVTPEQIRKASLKNISIFKRMYKFSTTWSLFAITPLLVLIFAFSPNMTTIGFWILGTYLVIDFLLHFLLMRRMKRVDHSELDLRTLLNEESFYNKSAFALTCVGFAFWIVFNYFFLGIIASVAMLVFFILTIGTKTKFFTRKINFREITIPEPKEPGKFRKAMSWLFIGLMAILTLIFAGGIIYNAIGGTMSLMEFLSRAGFIIITAAFVVNFMVLDKYRKGLAGKVSMAITIAVVAGLLMSAIPVVHTAIVSHTFDNGALSPILMGFLTLFLNGTIRNMKDIRNIRNK